MSAERSGIEALWYPQEKETVRQRIARAPLSLLGAPYRAGVLLRNALYDRRVLRPSVVDQAKVISVGNLTAGGAGKTPVVMFLANRLAERGAKVAVLSRGYGRLSSRPVSFDASSLAAPSQAGDEPVLIAQRCPNVRVLVGANRVALAERAVQEYGAQVLLLDDGMQHRRLARQVDILVVDEAVGFGNGALLPRGPLREPLSSLSRASLVWIRAAKKPVPLPKFQQPVVRAKHLPKTVIDQEGKAHPAKTLAGRKVHALSGIARPSSFRRTLESLGAEVVGETIRPDHHYWEIEEVAEAAARKAGAILVTTEKDGVKLPPQSDAWVLRMEVEIVSGEEHLEAALALRPVNG